MSFGYFKHDEYPLNRKCGINYLILKKVIRFMNDFNKKFQPTLNY